MTEGPVVISSPAGIEHFQMCQVIGALSIEVKTGLSHSRGSVLNLARERYGVKSRTKKGALAELHVQYKEKYGWEYGKAAS